MAEHDPSDKRRFSHRLMVADLVRGFVHEDWVAALDFDTLERVREIGISHDLRAREDDIIWLLHLLDPPRGRAKGGYRNASLPGIPTRCSRSSQALPSVATGGGGTS